MLSVNVSMSNWEPLWSFQSRAGRLCVFRAHCTDLAAASSAGPFSFLTPSFLRWRRSNIFFWSVCCDSFLWCPCCFCFMKCAAGLFNLDTESLYFFKNFSSSLTKVPASSHLMALGLIFYSPISRI